MLFATEPRWIASNGFVPDEEQMLDLTETDGLFEHFEVNAAPFWPIVSRLVGGSIILHLVLGAAVFLIPPVRDALSVAVMFRGGGFVDRPYAKTQIADDADIIEFTTERFRYPEGYFMMDQQGMPFPTPTPIAFTPSFVPKPVQPQAQVSPTPSFALAASPSPVVAANSDNKNSQAGKTDPALNPNGDKTDEKAQQELAKTAGDAGIDLPKEGEINSRPFKDLGIQYDGLQRAGKMNLQQPFEIVIETELDSHGKLVNSNVTKKAGDANLVELSKQFVSALNDSGILFYLKALNNDNPNAKVVFTIKQDKTAVVASIESEATSNDSARVLVKGFNAALAYGIHNRAGKSEEPLLRSTTAIQDGKKIIFNFAMPRDAVVEMIEKGIASPSPSPS